MNKVPYNPAVFRTLMFRNGWSEEEAARRLDSSERKIHEWALDGAHPGWGSIDKMADAFGIKARYFSPKRTAEELAEAGILPDMRTRMFYLMQSLGMSEKDLSVRSGVRIGRIRDYLHGNRANSKTVRDLAAALGTSEEFLKGSGKYVQQEFATDEAENSASGTREEEPRAKSPKDAEAAADEGRNSVPAGGGDAFYDIYRITAEEGEKLANEQVRFLIDMLIDLLVR